MDKPLWLLDVDGVINVGLLNIRTGGPNKPPKSAGWGDDWMITVASHQGVDWPMIAANPVLAFIREVHDTGLAEIRWLTTWEDDDGVRTIEEVFDFPEFPIAGRASDYPTDWWWKLPIAQKQQIPDVHRRIVWTDDDISHSRLAKEWLRTWDDRILPISPNSGMGLIPQHLTKIRKFLTDDGTHA
jgi:hypothetical protein